MSNQFNAVKFFETFARIIAEREKVDIKVTVRLKDENMRVITLPNSDRKVMYRRTQRLSQRSA